MNAKNFPDTLRTINGVYTLADDLSNATTVNHARYESEYGRVVYYKGGKTLYNPKVVDAEDGTMVVGPGAAFCRIK